MKMKKGKDKGRSILDALPEVQEERIAAQSDGERDYYWSEPE